MGVGGENDWATSRVGKRAVGTGTEDELILHKPNYSILKITTIQDIKQCVTYLFMEIQTDIKQVKGLSE